MQNHGEFGRSVHDRGKGFFCEPDTICFSDERLRIPRSTVDPFKISLTLHK
jgi:hypothetical protein